MAMRVGKVNLPHTKTQRHKRKVFNGRWLNRHLRCARQAPPFFFLCVFVSSCEMSYLTQKHKVAKESLQFVLVKSPFAMRLTPSAKVALPKFMSKPSGKSKRRRYVSTCFP